jgi:alpha-tubulin suppressor-like RCC1 family protein
LGPGRHASDHKALFGNVRFVHIAAGAYHSAAVSENGSVYMWGRNSQGQLGLGKRAQTKVWMAQRLEALNDLVIKMMALGSEHSLALSEEGQVLSWGASLHGRLGHGHGYNPSMFSIFRTMRLPKNPLYFSSWFLQVLPP